MNSPFAKVLASAQEQSAPQRLLFMLAQSETTSKADSQAQGTISPLMCVDKLPEELSNFKDFVAEADTVSQDWNMIFIAAMPGENGITPSSEDAEPVLNMMVNDLVSGQDLSRYLILDRDEQQIEISQS